MNSAVRSNSRAQPYRGAFEQGLELPNNSRVAGFDPSLTLSPHGIVLRLQSGTPYSKQSFQDETGYEAFLNKLHLSEGSLLERSLAAGQMTAVLELERASTAPTATFRVIVSVADPDVAWRFHTVRPGQQWIAADLEGYEGEAIIVVDLAPSQ